MSIDFNVEFNESETSWNPEFAQTNNSFSPDFQDVITSGTSDFDRLINRPSYNGTEMTHETDIPEVKTATWDAKYNKPSGGIPSTDMTSAVQTSLGKADSAVQFSDLATVATSGSYNDLINKPEAIQAYTSSEVETIWNNISS